MTEVCIVCESEDVVGTCDKCDVNLCDRHMKSIGKGDCCPNCFKEVQDEEDY